MDLSKPKFPISNDASVVVCTNCVSCDLEGEAVILNAESGMYLGLDPIATRIWDLLQEQRQINDLLEILSSEYDVDVDQCERDVLVLLREMADHGLIKIKNGTTP